MASSKLVKSKNQFQFASQRQLWQFIKKYWVLYALAVPGVAYFIVFKYIPILGSAIAFQDYNVFRGIRGSEWIGLEHFERMFKYPEFLEILRNTLLLGLYDIVFAFPVPIILALLINELRLVVLKRLVQTAVYLPYFLSWVIVGGIVLGVLSPTTGIINNVLGWFGMEPIYFLGEKSYIRSIIIGSGIWRDSGWGTIIYLAAIAGVNPDLYESAEMDGAGRIRQTFSITLPTILPTIVILFLLQIGNFLELGFERVFVFLNPLNKEYGEIIDTFVYQAGLVDRQYSYTTAIGLFRSVVGLALIMIGNTLSKKATGESLY